jgi:hypothetical protein
MRTTVTLEPEVVRLLEHAMKERGQTFKRALNEALRRGLADLEGEAHEAPFEVEPRPMGLRAGLDPARLNSLVDEFEMDAHLDLTRHGTRTS